MIQIEYEHGLVEPSRGPDLTSLIDMVFILLIFFLLTSFVMLPSLDISLPETQGVETTNPGSLVISIRFDGALLLNGLPVSDEALRGSLFSRDPTSLDRELVIQADRRVPFGRVIEVTDLCREAGLKDISFLVEYREER